MLILYYIRLLILAKLTMERSKLTRESSILTLSSIKQSLPPAIHGSVNRNSLFFLVAQNKHFGVTCETYLFKILYVAFTLE